MSILTAAGIVLTGMMAAMYLLALIAGLAARGADGAARRNAAVYALMTAAEAVVLCALLAK